MNCPLSGVDLSRTLCGLDEPDGVHEHHHPTVRPWSYFILLQGRQQRGSPALC